MPFAVVELGQLVQVVWVSLAATIVVALAFALVVREGGRSGEARRNGRANAAALHMTLAAVLLVALVAMVIVGVILVLNK